MHGQAISLKDLRKIIETAALGDWLAVGGRQVPNGFRGFVLSGLHKFNNSLDRMHFTTNDERSMDISFDENDIEIIKRSDFQIRIISMKTRHDLLVLHHRRKKEIGAHVPSPKVNLWKSDSGCR
jgi:hypothetical protein